MKKWLSLWLTAVLLLALRLPPARGEAKWPESSTAGHLTNGKLTVDAAHMDEGYFLAAVSAPDKHAMKLRVAKGRDTVTYNLNSDGAFEVFPLQLGSGKYELSLMENVSGKKFSSAGKITLEVALNREDAAFFYPNQYVNYTRLSLAVAMADKLCAGKTENEIYNIVRDYVMQNFGYDFIKAVSMETGDLPDIDGCFDAKKGTVQDLSALMVCMLRSQGIPARFAVGYADKTYHAWMITPLGGKEETFDPAVEMDVIKPKKYSVERCY